MKIMCKYFFFDVHLQLQNLLTRITELEKEKKEIHDKFNAQRGRLQKLYIQKEEELNLLSSQHVKLECEVIKLTKELDEAKSQLCIAGIVKENEVEAEKRKAQAEIATLNQIVHDTVQVSNTSQSEVKKLKQVIELLESQLNKLKGEKEKEGLLLAPSNMLSGAKTLARKVVGQLGNDSDYRIHDNLEDSMKKAQEDTEVLKSLVIPLEEKILELTQKLQAAESKLLKYEPNPNKTTTTNYVNSNSTDINERDEKSSSRDASQQEEEEEEERYHSSQMKCNATKGRHEEENDDLKSSISSSNGNGNNNNNNNDNDNDNDKELKSLASGSGLMIKKKKKKLSSCDMCANYEAQLVSQQKHNLLLQKEKEKMEKNMEKLKDDFTRETQFRKNMEDKWNEKKEKHKAKVAELKELYEGSEKEIKMMRETFAHLRSEVEIQLNRLAFDRKEIYGRLEEIQRENDNLVGKHSRHSAQLREESINFPDNVEDLQVLLLKTHEELISAKTAKEAKEEQETNLKYEIQLLRDQLNSEMSERNAKESDLALQNSELSKLLNVTEKENYKLKEIAGRLNALDKEQKEQMRALKTQLDKLMKENRSSEETISKLQSRVSSLQQQLDTSEAVQKDFVRLSQSLQIELEKIRGADTEVRWQHEDDVEDCPNCKITFSASRKKVIR
ncbi:Cytoplasmic linker protein, putative [Pediculus humanus corporis]|uniref:Cytoplasmic linker protein, putative n=1 Tax=Pediculus humanus subsp. corporis TaxID=121224 RepID=E0VKX1_PEDHC|nr:Cytoplasmic linker protein, putative [Pediculus humanus corporis]EEB14027.1 Cytoplasmic linker protein, putative [Pediculus humanus corporis]